MMVVVGSTLGPFHTCVQGSFMTRPTVLWNMRCISLLQPWYTSILPQLSLLYWHQRAACREMKWFDDFVRNENNISGENYCELTKLALRLSSIFCFNFLFKSPVSSSFEPKDTLCLHRWLHNTIWTHFNDLLGLLKRKRFVSNKGLLHTNKAPISNRQESYWSGEPN